MKVLIFGDANVDVTVKWADVEKNLHLLSARNRKLVLFCRSKSQKGTSDLEYYLGRPDAELSKFFNSLDPVVRPGGCGAIKAMSMARLGHKVIFYSWVGDDGNGIAVLDDLSDAGVDVSNVIVAGRTCETYNLSSGGQKRLAMSYWKPKIKFSGFLAKVKKERPDAVFLTGAHRVKAPMGYAKLPGAFVFTGSFSEYSKAEIAKKYGGDFSNGILVANDAEIVQLSGARDAFLGMKKLANPLIVMHGRHLTAVKRGSRTIISRTLPLDRRRVTELTGIGDVWESTFIGSVGNLKKASEQEIRSAMLIASKAAIRRMTMGN